MEPKDSVIKFVIKGVKQGYYAFSVYHDKNSNDKIDYNYFGVPSEAIGFSNNPDILFAAPSFRRTRVDVKDNSKAVTIDMIYPY